MDDFYDRLSSFGDFRRLGDDRFYAALPEEWYVVISDIRGSTKAIQEGRYQDVNTLGAASIAAVQSVLQGHEVPFVFGGDGASFLVPVSKIDAVKRVLLKLKNFARVKYQMDMRIGAVAMKEVVAYNQVIEVAKFAIAEGKTIALMRGGGLSFAENLIKKLPEKYCFIDDSGEALPELAGLSCRWQPLQSQKGSMLSILIKPIGSDPTVLDRVLTRFEEIFEGQMLAANPVNIRKAKYKSLWGMLKTESSYSYSFFSSNFVARFLMILVSLWAFRWGGPAPFRKDEYLDSMPSHSDYRKFDDMLRMVLDCTPRQIEAITKYLKEMHAENLLCFGLHESPHALMTCLVETLQQGGHIHFIDGGDGGYAIAAKYLKDQLAKVQS
jgi:hypothetical protein